MAEKEDRETGVESRRRFLKKGVFGTLLLVAAGSLPIALRSTRRRLSPRGPLQIMTSDEHAVLAAVAGRIVPGPGAAPNWPTAESLDCAGKIDTLMARAHPSMGKELRQLLHLFENGFVGMLTTLRPTPFTRLDPEEQDERLAAWRDSRFGLLRSGYQALRRLCEAVYYSTPEVHSLVGYPGPPNLRLLAR